MRILFRRDETRGVTIGTVEGRPEAMREFSDFDFWPGSPIREWIIELHEYMGEEVESITVA
ncbi:hypothetical protein LCGC14_1461710 [marine sediment metagenome]|uniref:Uncharacterized protein n=1 Tax=marine sediment metagenome TaxID=412755 RepID=A0A0F9LVJ3_9ZZZZ